MSYTNNSHNFKNYKEMILQNIYHLGTKYLVRKYISTLLVNKEMRIKIRWHFFGPLS